MSEWKTVRLGDVCVIITGNTPSTKNEQYYSSKDIPFIKPSDLPANFFSEIKTSEFFISESARPISRIIPKNSVLVSCIGIIGKVGISKREVSFNQQINALIPNISQIDYKYLASAILNKKKYISEKANAAVVPIINKTEFSNLEIPLPPLETQKQIAAVLDKCTSLISKYKKMLEKYDTLIKSRFIEMFGEYERTTTITRYISELRGGKSLAGTEPCKNKVLKTGAATFGWFDPEQYKYLPVDYEPLPEHKVETGDVIISRMNTPELVGACSYVFEAPEDMYYPDRLWKAVLKENTNPIFLWQLLWDRDIRKAIEDSSSGTSGTMHNISKANLLAIKCIDAPIGLQNDFASFVQQIDKSKFAVQKSLEKAETLYKSLMQEYFG